MDGNTKLDAIPPETVIAFDLLGYRTVDDLLRTLEKFRQDNQELRRIIRKLLLSAESGSQQGI